jgi:negative regulator of sigma E activity
LEDLNRSIAGLDLDWADLSLSFLWWDGARVIGSERVRGRFCHIVDLKAPEGQVSRYAGVRLWIDPETSLLMQADAYDARNRPVRRLQVKSLRKIDDIWMVQNLDIFTQPSRDRVTLRVRNVKALDDSFEEDWD